MQLMRTQLTTSSIVNPFVHLIRTPEETDNCLIGKENVKPSSFFEPGTRPFSSLSINSFIVKAIKSKSSCVQR